MCHSCNTAPETAPIHTVDKTAAAGRHCPARAPLHWHSASRTNAAPHCPHTPPPTLALEVAYVGNVGRHLYETLNANEAVPGPGNADPRRPFYQLYGLEQFLAQYCNCDTSSYNGLQTKLQKQVSHG